MVAVIGSGPTAVACAWALVQRGIAVTMIDAGLTLEAEREDAVSKVRAAPPSEWRGDLMAPLRENTDPSVSGLPAKLLYGSSYPFRSVDPTCDVVMDGVDTLASHAAGGLSNLWGANVLPFLDADLEGWPFDASELAPFYRAVATFMPMSVRRDELEALFPVHTDGENCLTPSGQADAMLRRLRRSKTALHGRGVYFGQSRLAVRTYDERGAPGCVYCGYCLYGCPYGLIYSSASTLPALRRDPRFRYVSGVLVERFDESGEKVHLAGRSIDSGQPFALDADRVFIGCGTINTAKLVLYSVGALNTEVDLLDSQYFMVPYVSLRGTRHVLDEKLNTLSQICLEVLDAEISDRSVHVLIYTYNDLYRRAIEKLLGALAPLARPALGPVFGRLAVLQGYLHSDYSARIGMTLETSGSSRRRLVLRAKANPSTRPMVKRILRKLRSIAHLTGAAPVPFMTQIGMPGKSYHTGGSFPMRTDPGPLQTDTLGRLHGYARVHIVDASVFPSIPATNSTFSAMANAYRVGTLAGE